MATLETVTTGFMPLIDCMLPVIAKEKGFAENHGLDLRLRKEQSWASIRDHMAVGHFDASHMLAPMPIAFNTGLVPFSVPVIAPIALGLGGNAVTVSNALWQELREFGAVPDANPKINGASLKKVINRRADANLDKLRFGVVHPYSGHNLELRYWLAACGVSPERDVEIIVVPPPLMSDALQAGRVDGYCVGEPWNSHAVDSRVGTIITTKSAIWRSSPEKVLGVQTEFAERKPETLSALLRAIHDAARWCGVAENREELSLILARPEYVGADQSTIMKALNGSIETEPENVLNLDDFMIPFERAATFPWQSHALWFYSQMVRWGQLKHTLENSQMAMESYRPDLYRSALSESEAAVPAANMKVEGALEVSTSVGSTKRLQLGPDGFFDGRIFDPDKLDEYIASFKIADNSKA